MYIHNVNLDVNAQPDANAKPCLRLSQNENGRILMIRIIGVDIPEGSTANFAGVKPDGNVYSKAGTVEGNVVSINEDIQMTAVSGAWNAKITVVNDGNNICTARIRVVVDASVVPGDAIPSDSQLDGIVAECQAYAESAKNAAYGSPLTANTAADMTDQDRVYVYTGSESGYTNGHWYYYDGSAWADGGVYNAVAVQTDTTLTQAGKAADAKKTGDEITALKEDLNDVNAELADVRVGADGITYGSAGAAVRGQLNDVQKALNFDDIAHVTSRIDWNTVNKTITIGIGYIVYAGGYKRISSAISATYTNFNNITVLMYDTENSNLIFVPFNSLHKGIAIALFNLTKIYMPYDYDNVYLDGEKITTANIYDGFTSFIDSVNAQVNSIDAEVNGIKNTIDLVHEKENIYNQNNVSKSSITDDNIWIINDLTIPVGTVLTSLTLYFVRSGEKSFDVSLWNEATGEKYYSESFTVTPNNLKSEIQITKKIEVPTKIGFTSQANSITATSITGHSLLYVPIDATSLENASTLNKWVINATITAIKPVSMPVLNQEIHVGNGLDFEEIQYALDSLQSDYATIIVHPKDTPYSRFSLMRSLNGSYPWAGLTTVKHISIIGVDKTKCIIQSDTGNYDSPPAEIATNGIIKNLTFIATHDDSDGTETTGSYAVHVDNRPADENGMKLVFENCDFISYQTAAVGLGLYRNQDILFDSCNFKSITDSTWKPNENYDSAYMCALGAYFMHTTMGYAGGNMFIRFRNCFLYHEGGNYVMRIADADSTQTALLEAINNTLWNGTDQNTGYHTTGNPIMQMPYNHGNNATGLNA